MLWDPVTYAAEKFHVVPLVLLFNQFCERYRMPDVTVGVIACVRFTTCTRFWFGSFSSALPPHS